MYEIYFYRYFLGRPSLNSDAFDFSVFSCFVGFWTYILLGLKALGGAFFIFKNKDMGATMRKFFCILLALCLLGGNLSAQEAPLSFDQAKQQLRQAQAQFLQNLTCTVGAAAAATVGGKILYRRWQDSKSLRSLVEQLRVPKGSSGSVKYLAKEKAALRREVKKMEDIYQMILRRQPKKTFFWEMSPELKPRTYREVSILKQSLMKRYAGFETRLAAYKAAYKEYTKTHRIAAAEGLAARPVARGAANVSGRQIMKALPKKWPLALLLALTLVSDTPAVSRMAHRLEQNPSLALSLTPQEEQTIRHHAELTDIYVHIASQVNELAQLPPEQLQPLVEQAYRQQHQILHMKSALRQSLAR